MSHLIHTLVSYFQDANPSADSHLIIWGLIGAGILWALGVIGWLFRHSLERFARRRSDLVEPLLLVARWAGFVWAILFFLRYEFIPPFQYRLWLYLPLVGFGAWVVTLVVADLRRAPLQVNEQERYNRYEKYLPLTRKRQPARARRKVAR